MLTKVIVGLLLCITLAQAIRIHTSEFESIYSGEGGAPEDGWDNKADQTTLYTRFISVAEFMFSGSNDDNLYYPTRVEIMSAPKVTVEEGQDIVDPIVQGDAKDGYHFEGSSYYEELPQLNIIFNCQKPGRALLSVSVEVSSLDQDVENAQPVTETVKFYFRKECINTDGYRTGFNIGRNAANDVVYHGVVQHKWLVDSYYDLYADSNVIGENEPVTSFTIFISSEAYGNQYFFAPEIHVEDDDVLTATSRGNFASGGIATVRPETLSIIYDCHTEGTTGITVSISLGFYGTIRFGFLKSCKSDANHDDENKFRHTNPGLINVGTSRSEYASVVDQSVTSLFWDVETTSVVIEREEIFTNFYISTKSGETQEVLKPIVTINPPVFGVSLSGPFRDGGVATGAPSSLTVNYLCKRVSEAQIIISLKLPGYKTIEFSYLKKCKALKRHKGHVWTANQVMILFVVFVVVVGLCAFSYYRKVTATAPQKTKPARP